MSDGLLPCPFCGSEAGHDEAFAAHPIYHAGDEVYYVSCDTCEFDAAPRDSLQEAVDFWNQRAPAPPSPVAGEEGGGDA